MWRITLLAAILLCAACGPVKQPESLRTVAAYEVPLHSAQDRTDFLAQLRQEAKAEGLHVDAASPEELAETARAIPVAAMTIHAAVWRGSDDDQAEATIMDGSDHPGRAWIVFGKGEDPALARRFRERAMRKVFERWPETLSLPIMPTGAIPLSRDLRRTAYGYEVDPAAASQYEARP